jgi:hypothetical protein
MSNYDRFHGLIGDSGILLGKFGQDAKPFVDRVREILSIVWLSQARTEELPSNTPQHYLKKMIPNSKARQSLFGPILIVAPVPSSQEPSHTS